MQVSVQQIAAFLVASFCLFTTTQATHCSAPPQLRNGKYTEEVGGYYKRGHVISYLCDNGFKLEGHSQIRCAYSRRYKSLQWSDVPECIVPPLPPPDYPPAYKDKDGIDGGDETLSSSSNSESSSSLESSSRYGPDSRFDLHSSSSPDFCSASGLESSSRFGPKSRSDPKSSSRSGPKSSSRSGPKSRSRFGPKSRSGPKSRFRSCPKSNSRSGPKSRSRSGPKPSSRSGPKSSSRSGHYQRGSFCIPTKCPLLPRPNHGCVRYTEKWTSAGASVWYTCNVGYALVGAETRTCLKNLRWSSSAPICKRASCDRPEKPVNGLVWFRSRAAGARADYKCNANHRLVGASVRTCQRTREWTPEVPKCERVRCERLVNPRNGFVVVSTKMDIGTYAKYNCYDGFYLIWPKFRKCVPTGWSGKEPKCNAVKCDALKAPTHGCVHYSNGRYFNSTATYWCDFSHTFKQGSGDKNRICQNYGVWTGKAPTCILKEVECKELKNPKNGIVFVTGRGLHDSATYTCMKGYTLSRLQTRLCQRNSKWSASEPNCTQTIARCPVPPKPRQGYIKAHCYSQGCSVTFFCQQGYELFGARNALCLQIGQWSSSCPVCKRKM